MCDKGICELGKERYQHFLFCLPCHQPFPTFASRFVFVISSPMLVNLGWGFIVCFTSKCPNFVSLCWCFWNPAMTSWFFSLWKDCYSTYLVPHIVCSYLFNTPCIIPFNFQTHTPRRMSSLPMVLEKRQKIFPGKNLFMWRKMMKIQIWDHHISLCVCALH